MRLCQWWADSTSPGWNRVKVSENLGATTVALVAPVDTSLVLYCVASVDTSLQVIVHVALPKLPID